jgi:hypothetical protein
MILVNHCLKKVLFFKKKLDELEGADENIDNDESETTSSQITSQTNKKKKKKV